MVTRLCNALMLTASLALVACGPFPDARNRSHERAVAREIQRRTPTVPAGHRAADPAETACLNAAVASGFQVRGIDGSSEVPGPDGRPVARRIVLSVTRGGGPVIAWPCTYHLTTGRAAAA